MTALRRRIGGRTHRRSVCGRLEGAGASAVDQETIRAIIEGFAEGRIELPKAKGGAIGNTGRYAPSFSKASPNVSGRPETLYTAAGLATFTGKPEARVEEYRRGEICITVPCAASTVANTYCCSSRLAQQLRQLGEVRRDPPRYIQFILSARATRHQADWGDGVDGVAMLIEGRPFDPCNSLWLRL